jgi:hypothetical protein
MRIYRNDKFIQRRAKIGRYAFFGGAGVLALGLIVSFTSASPETLIFSFVTLIVGFILTQVSVFYGARYARATRPDELLSKSLKGFDDHYILFQYATPAANVLVTPNACYVFAIKLQSGAIEYKNGKWKHKIGGARRFFLAFNQDALGNPVREADMEADALRRFLTKKLPNVEVPIQPVIVFGDENAEVDAGESPTPALHVKKLKDWLRGPGKSGDLSSSAHDQVIQLFEPTTTN